MQTTSATCHSGEGLRDTSSFPTDPSQVMSPSLGQTLPQDSALTRDPPPMDTGHQPKEHERKDEHIPTPKLEQE